MSEPGVRSADPPERRFNSDFNWVWMVDVRDECAVEVLDRGNAPDPRLEGLFARVERCRVGGERFELGIGDGEADVVVFGGLLPRLAARLPPSTWRNGGRPEGPEVAILAESRRVLREGGVVQFIVENSMWHRRLRRRLDLRGDGPESPAAARPGVARRWLRRAGFESARAFYVDPRSGFPEGLIPGSGVALEAHERLCGTASGLRRTARRALARTGLRSVLHPRILILGFA